MQTIVSFTQRNALPVIERKFWYFAEALVTTVPVQDNGEELVNIGDVCARQGVSVICAPVLPLRGPTDLFARVGVVERLIKVIQMLLTQSDGRVTLKITDAYRPLSIQRQLFHEIRDDIAKKEGLLGQALWERVTQFIADPDLCPPHSTGGAIDCTLAYLDGQELDMGTPLDLVDDRANTWSLDLPQAAKDNRQLLFSSMAQAGMVNLATEWWHYSYGDQYWAVYTGVDISHYASREEL